MNNAFSAPQIHQQILKDSQSCEALLKLLSEEREALHDRDMDELERIVTEKTTHLVALEHSANERGKLVRAHAAGEEQDHWQEFIDNLGDEQLSGSWNKLKELLQQCKLENEVNGKLLTRNHQIYSRLLDIVRGQHQAPSLYNSQGGSSSSGSSNIVGEA